MTRPLAALATALAVTAAAPAAAASEVPQPPAPRGVVVLVPGSGFNGTDQRSADRMSLPPATWRRWGLRTVVAGYGRGRRGLADVRDEVGRARAAHPGLPLTLYGESSGGTWALLLAAEGLADRLVAFAAPTDQETLARADSGGARHLGRVVWPRHFGDSDEDNALEPFDVWSAAAPALPVLLGYSRGDHIVPVQQGRLLQGVAPAADLLVLARGHRRFVHAPVTRAGYARLRRAARALASGP